MGTITLQNCLVGHTHIPSLPAVSRPGIYPTGKFTCMHQNTQKRISQQNYSPRAPNRNKWTPIRRMDKWIVIHPCHGLPHSSANGWSTDMQHDGVNPTNVVSSRSPGTTDAFWVYLDHVHESGDAHLCCWKSEQRHPWRGQVIAERNQGSSWEVSNFCLFIPEVVT